MVVLLCRLCDLLPPLKSAAAVAAQTVTTAASIGAAYAASVVTVALAQELRFDNQTDGDVVVSLDNGVTDHYTIPAGTERVINYGKANRYVSGQIALKDGARATNNGSFYIYSYV